MARHPAMVAAGHVTDEGKLDRGPYAMRPHVRDVGAPRGHPTFTVARRLGTSVEMIEATYGHLAHDAEEWELDRLEAFDRADDGRKLDAVGSGESH